MFDLKTDSKESEELKKFNHYLNKKKEILRTGENKVEDIFGNVLGQDIISQEQIIKPISFSPKVMQKLVFVKR